MTEVPGITDLEVVAAAVATLLVGGLVAAKLLRLLCSPLEPDDLYYSEGDDPERRSPDGQMHW